MFNFVFDFLFPKRCINCKKLGHYLCSKCQKKINFITQNICPVCEKASLHGITHPICQTRYCLDGLFSAFLYEGIIRKMLLYFKYKPYLSDLALELVNLLEKSIKINQNNLITQFIKNERPIIVPVPLYKKREKERGYNQSEILGRLLAKKFKLTFWGDLLVRIKPTKPQAGLTKEQRAKNIRKAFKINPELRTKDLGQKLKNINILLIDDIWTTGITLRTCGNLLKRAEFKKVWGLTLAR